MPQDERSLPKFDNPPVVEALLGVEFAALAKWGIEHFGLLWARLREDYKEVESAPALPPAPPLDKTGARQSSVLIMAPGKFDARCLFHDRNGTGLLQVQNDRFVRNWRKTPEATGYSGYDSIAPEFEREWGRFCKFLDDNEIERPSVSACEVSYVNHLDKGVGWNDFSDLKNVMRPWAADDPTGFLPAPSELAIHCRYKLPAEQGHLVINLQPAVRLTDGAEILQLSLTARGRPSSSVIRDLRAWMDLGHEWIVRGFDAFTSTKMHAIWKKR